MGHTEVHRYIYRYIYRDISILTPNRAFLYIYRVIYIPSNLDFSEDLKKNRRLRRRFWTKSTVFIRFIEFVSHSSAPQAIFLRFCITKYVFLLKINTNPFKFSPAAPGNLRIYIYTELYIYRVISILVANFAIYIYTELYIYRWTSVLESKKNTEQNHLGRRFFPDCHKDYYNSLHLASYSVCIEVR